MDIRPFQPEDEAAVIALWERCKLTRPWNDPKKDVARKLGVQRELFLVGVEAGSIVAAVMAAYDGHRGSVNYLAVDPQHRRRGHGTTRRRTSSASSACSASSSSSASRAAASSRP